LKKSELSSVENIGKANRRLYCAETLSSAATSWEVNA
jgi:hypothetical protein